ncbi:extracellular solute-binding protein [Paenibacillus pasadenensis]|uniref:ABC transporter substrate-binding protein n=1 Tax=Paenibacillus pasadenensis TaxID=217090 RepID=UPI00203FB463|nr:extracellular solute-binding protein [Paenibacillus pasadenensis]MCM3746910.1 extracellular solute-binding protein [Paenibacillus pasadenensis]
MRFAIGLTASKRRTVALAGFLLLAVTSGCSLPADAPPIDSPPGSLIKFVAAEYSPLTKPMLEKLVREFESRNPTINVELQVVGWDIMDGIYTNMLAQNDPPDLLNVYNYSHLVEQGLLNDFEELLPVSFRSNLQPYLVKLDRIGEKQYAIPYVASVRSLYYNKKLFQQAGVQAPPATWSELKQTAARIGSETQANGFGIGMSDDDIAGYLSYFFFGAGGGWLKDGRWAINQPANVEGLEMLKFMYEANFTDEEPWMTTREDKQRFVGEGTLGMLISGNFFSSFAVREFPDLEWGRSPIPVKDGMPPLHFGVQDVLVSFKTAHSDPKAIASFIEFLYEDSYYTQMVLNEGFLPVTRTGELTLAVNYPGIQADLTDLSEAHFFPVEQERWGIVIDAARSLGSAVLEGRYSPQKALDELQSVAEGADNRYR